MGDRDKRLEYSSVVEPILKYLNSLPKSKAINIRGGVFTERGTPDILGSINGRTVAFECKRDATEGPRKIQKWRLCEWMLSGAIVGSVSDVWHVQYILQLLGVI